MTVDDAARAAERIRELIKKKTISKVIPIPSARSIAAIIREECPTEEKLRLKCVPAEALFVFMGWLTTREEHVSFGCTLDASEAADLVGLFIKHNNLSDPDMKNTLLSHPVVLAATEKRNGD